MGMDIQADEKAARNRRVQARYDELMREGKHGHYETMFRVVREEVEFARKLACEAGYARVIQQAEIERLTRLAENPPMAQSSKEKQEAFRARQAMLGLKEVRGIYLPESLHPKLKELAQKLLAESQQPDKR